MHVSDSTCAVPKVVKPRYPVTTPASTPTSICSWRVVIKLSVLYVMMPIESTTLRDVLRTHAAMNTLVVGNDVSSAAQQSHERHKRSAEHTKTQTGGIHPE
jgi:hypothetical protein